MAPRDCTWSHFTLERAQRARHRACLRSCLQGEGMCDAVIVSTVTGTASLGKVPDLWQLYDQVEPAGSILALRSPDGKNVKPVEAMPVLAKTIGRHVSFVIQLRTRNGRCHAKVFASGVVHVTGIRSSSEISEACTLLSQTMTPPPTAFDIRTRMINAYFKHRPTISRSALVRHVTSTTKICAIFDPMVSPEACIVFCFASTDPRSVAQHDGRCACSSPCAFLPSRLRRCFRVIVKVHATGTIMLSGCVESHIHRTATLMQDFMDTITT